MPLRSRAFSASIKHVALYKQAELSRLLERCGEGGALRAIAKRSLLAAVVLCTDALKHLERLWLRMSRDPSRPSREGHCAREHIGQYPRQIIPADEIFGDDALFSPVIEHQDDGVADRLLAHIRSDARYI